MTHRFLKPQLRTEQRLLRVSLWAVMLLISVLPSSAQPSDIPISPPFKFPAIAHGSIDFGDANGDGLLDIVIAGNTLDGPIISTFIVADSIWYIGDADVHTLVYRRLHSNIHPVSEGVARWGDYDGDGDDDLLVTGLSEFVEGTRRHFGPVLEVYRNEGVTFQFAAATLATTRQSLPGLYRSAAAWADFDGDGDLDFVAAGLPSLNDDSPVTRLYRNESGTFVLVDSDLPGVTSGDLAWADYDGDGDPDLALMGDTGGGVFAGRLFRNDNGWLTDSGTDLPPLAFGALDWGDYDQDGDPDLLITGGRLDPRFLHGETYVYRNDGGTLADSGFDLPGHTIGVARWGDADRDGDLDIFVVGSREALGPPKLHLFAFDGSDFVEAWDFTGVRFGAMDVADYNGDDDADVAMSGQLSVGGLHMRFLLNRDYKECVVNDWLRPGQSIGECL